MINPETTEYLEGIAAKVAMYNKVKKEAVTYLVDNQIQDEQLIQNALIMSLIWLAHQIDDPISIGDIMIYLGNTATPEIEEIDEIILDESMVHLTLTEALEAAVGQ